MFWLLIALCVGASATAFACGERVPGSLGIGAVLLFVVAQTYFLSLADDPQAVVASAQQLPVAAFYLGWFVRPVYAVLLSILCIGSFGIAMAANPLFWPEGLFGVTVLVHALIGFVFCFGVGTYLWRRNARRATADPLTGAYNRSGFTERLDSLIRRFRRSSVPFCLVAIDFDDFKGHNDSFGHASGDAVLVDTVELLNSRTRMRDVIGRLGGDEFALLFPDTREGEVDTVLSRLRNISPHAWSWGVAQMQPGDTADTLFSRADAGLYEQKLLRREAVHDG